jgi:hypothetical protein
MGPAAPEGIHDMKVLIQWSVFVMLSARAIAVADSVITLVPASAPGWRAHVVDFDGIPSFAAPGFDDGAWVSASAPFSSGGCGYGGASNWPLGTDLLLRRVIFVPLPCSLRCSAAIDNDVRMFLDGVPLGGWSVFEGCDSSFRYQAVVDVASPGFHLLAVRARDRGVASYLDVAVEARPSSDCNADGIDDAAQCQNGSLPDFNGNSIPDCCEAGSPCVVGNYPVQWRLGQGGNGHWYQRRDGDLPEWPAAAVHSRQIGGYLASITTAAENEFVAGVAYQGDLSGKMGPLLGGFKDGAGQFRWVTGEPFSFLAFGPGEPNGGLAEPYLHFKVYGSPGTPAWNDVGGWWSYLVEWSSDCDEDGIVDKGQILRGQLPDTNNNGIPDGCEVPSCIDADIYRDFNVNGADLGILLSQWGPNTPLTESDLNRDGAVDGLDLGLLLSFWGPCL